MRAAGRRISERVAALTGYDTHHEKWKKSQFLFLLGLFYSVSFLIGNCGASDLSQKNTFSLNESTMPSLTVQKNTSISVTNPETFVYLPKTDYQSGEPIEISGSTPRPEGTHLFISIYTMGYHQKTMPAGKTKSISKDVMVENSPDSTGRNFFARFDSTTLLPGDYYIVVDNLDAGPDEESTLNRTSFSFTIDKSLIPTQSGIPLVVTALMTMIAVFLVSIWKKGIKRC